MTYDPSAPLRRRARQLRDDRLSAIGDLGQTALVAVVAVSVIVALIGATIVATVVQSFPLQQAAAVSVYAHRALQAGENAYLTAVNANPGLAQCNTGTNNSGRCQGLNYGKWNLVSASATNSSGASADGFSEWYAFGNPQPTFDPTTHALTSLSVQVAGAAHAPNTKTNYVFQSENINLVAQNGFLTNVWWSNFESYNGTGDYSSCDFNWNLGYNILAGGTACSPVYFGPHDYLFGPVFTNDSVFVSGDGTVGGGPSFGNSGVTPSVPSPVTTADPACLFVDNTYGMSGGSAGCSTASGDVALYDTAKSSFGKPVQTPPQSNAQLGTIAAQNGCLYSGPTQITLSTDVNGVGQMTVVSPNTVESTVTVNGLPVMWDTANIASNYNNCPNNGTAPLPANGVVFVQNATTAPVTGANPFDNYVNNSVTNLTSDVVPSPNNPVTLTATVTSASSQIPSGATVSFSETTATTDRRGRTSYSTAVIPACSAVSNWSAPIASGGTWTSTATCPTTESSNGTGTFSATYSGGSDTSSSQGNLGQTNTLIPSLTYGPNSQTNAGGCSNCYYGQSSSPDAEGDAFVKGSLSGQLTIGTANNVIITGNLTYADCSGKWITGQSGEPNSFCPYNPSGMNDSLGLIANNYVEVNHPVTLDGSSVLPTCGSTDSVLCDPSNAAGGITIDAAILALTQSFVVNNYWVGNNEGQLNAYGSIQQFARGPVGTFNGVSTVSGYQKHYTWNPLLDFTSPPSYLVPSTAPWVLSSVNANGGAHTTTICPALTGIFNGTGPGTPISQYCAASPGGLPGYPAITAPSPPTNATATASAGGTATVTWSVPSDNGSPIRHYDIIANPQCSTCSNMSVSRAGATSASITGLTPGTTYVFMVTATNDYGTSDASNPTPSVTSPTVPYAPTLVSAVGNVNDTVTVNWTDPSSVGSPITQYTITPSSACPACTGLTQSSPTATSTIITGLTVGATYTFTVSATNGLGVGPPSVASNPVVVPTRPGAPTGVTGTSYANGQSVVSWNPPASNGGLAITGYSVTSSPANRTCTTTGTVSCTINGLTNGTAYTFTVNATNPMGTGPASAASPPATPSVVPGAPTIGTATNGVGSAIVTFSAPASNGGAPVTRYTVTSNPGGLSASCAASPCTVSGLTSGTTYTFRVTATNGSGTGPASGSSNSIVATGPPAQPFNVSATSYADSKSVVSWSAPASGGSPITRYTVTSSGGQTCTTPNGSTTTCTVTGLTNGVTYSFTVTATNALGVGAASSPASATPGAVPGAPTIGTATGAHQSAAVTWSPPSATGGLPITGYTVTSSPGNFTCVTSGTACTVTGLTNGTSYTFKVTATNAAGTGAASAASNAVVPAPTPPGAPTSVGATSFANTQSVVSWSAAAANGSAVTRYTVTSSGGQTCTTPNGSTTSCTVTGLTNGTAYTFTVTATNGIGTGPASAASAPATPSTIPGAPTAVVATPFGNSRSTVSWTAPVSNGGNPVTSYTVTSSPGNFRCTTSGTSCTVTGLTNGTSYTFTVSATNGSGTGPTSSASPPIVPAAVPGAPTSVAATSNANAQSVVTWNAPSTTGGSPITSYTVTSSGGQTCNTPNGSTRTCTVVGLTNGTSYTFTVSATNAAGTGAPSAPSPAVTPATLPGAPTGVVAANHFDSISVVTWTPPASNGGSPITSYMVTSSSGQTCTTPDGATTTCTITGLTNGSTYTFTVTATNALGTGPASSPSAPIVPAASPGAPSAVTATSNSNAQSLVSWTAPSSTGGSAITYYTVTTNAGQSCVTANGSTFSCLILGLTNGTTYTFTVVATNAIGAGPASSPVSATPTAVAGAPTGVTATSFANTTSVVSWTPPAPNGSAAISGYTVTATDLTTPANGGQISTSAASPTTVTGLTNGDSYTFAVTATNASGVGPASAASAPVTPATTPGAPTSVVGSSYANTQSVVSWTPPASNGGATITNYTVTSSPGGFTCSGPAAYCTVAGLTNGSSYTFTVVATNGAGSGPTSAASSPATPATVTGIPTGAVALATNASTEASVRWTAPTTYGGAAVTSYTVTSSPGAKTCTTANGSTTTCLFSGLATGITYTFSVTAANGAGSSPSSAPSNPLTVGTPGVPSSVNVVSYQNTQVPVTWTAPPTNGGAAITSYTATASPGGLSCTSAATNCTVAGLTNGTAYTFTVTAANTVGSGNPSLPSAPATPATAPSVPTSVVGTSFANTQSVVSWTTPASNGGAAISGYVVTTSPGGATCAVLGNSCTITGLTNGTAYTFTVTATNAAGTSAASAPSAPATPATVPGAPTAVTATSYADSQSVVSWTAPSSNGGAPITSYTATSSPGGFTCSTAATNCTVSGLTNGSTYTFTVVATNGAGTGPASPASGSALPATVPSVPSGVTATSYANTQSVVAWTASAGNGGTPITGYTVTASPGGATCAVLGTTCTVTGLTNGTTYTFTVTATNAAGTSAGSGPSAPATPATVPGVPTGVAATSYADTQSVVSWTAPASNGGATITGYTATSSPGGFTCSTASTSCTVSGLTNGTSYTFTVKATNPAGTGATSASSAPAVPAAVPGAPTSVNATSYSNAQSSVSWNAPSANGGATITSYTVTSAPGGFTCSTAGTSCTVAGLTNGTSYTFTVAATNPAGTGPASAASGPATPATVPGAPTSVTTTSNANTQSVVSWTAPVSSGGTPVISYSVTSTPGGFTCSTAGTSCTVTGLTNGTAYTFTVTATNSAGTGPASLASAPAVPATTAGAPTAVTATSNANSQSVVAWTAPASNGGATISAYNVTSTPGGFTCSTAGTSCTVTGLTNGTAYTFTVTATNSAGTGPASLASAPAVPATTAGAPTAVTALATSSATAAAVSWTAPASNGGAAITSYTVTSSPGAFTCTTAGTSCTVSGLTTGSSYTFTVAATNSAGTGAASAASGPLTVGTPGAPTGASATSNANTQSVVSWTAPAANGGSAVTSYTATATPGGLTCVTASTSCTVAGLTNGTSYTFTVTATNVVGAGTPSAASAAAIPATTPGSPTGVTATSNANAQSVVAWTAPASNGSAITGYTAISSPGGLTCSTSTTSCPVLGLTNGTSYTFTVTATNGVGTGSASVASAPAVPATTPDAPTAVTATATSTTGALAVAWTAPGNNGGSAVTSYTATASPGGLTCSTATTGCTVGGLTTGTAYTFTVRATNGVGVGTVSAASNSLVASVPGAPVAVVATATSSTTTATVSWTAPPTGGSAISSYTVTSSPGGITCSTTTTSCTVTPLATKTAYTFTVTATNANGTSPSSAASNSLTTSVPGNPSAVSAVATSSSTTANVAWTAPLNGGAAITTYTVTSSPGGVTCSTAATSCIVSGLTTGTTYSFTVTATNTNGSGPSSVASNTLLEGAPGAPTGVAGTNGGVTQSTVSWTAPLTGGSAIGSYLVTSSPGGFTCTTASTSCTVTGLTTSQPYTFTVTATNSTGTGPTSAPSGAATP